MRRSPDLALVLAVAAATILGSCSGPMDAGDPAAPDPGQASEARASAHGAFYPLQLGNRWEYDMRERFRIELAGQPPVEFVWDSNLELELTCEEQHEDHALIVERSRETLVDGGAPQELISWILYRQDPSGLYEIPPHQPPSCESHLARRSLEPLALARREGRLDAMLAAVPASARAGVRAAWATARLKSSIMRRQPLPELRSAESGMRAAEPLRRRGGALLDELTRLRYPLRPGQKWVVTTEGITVLAEVEGHETLALPIGRVPATRVRLELPGFFGPQDSVLFWYSRSGFVMFRAHTVGTVVDAYGNEVGRFVSDGSQILRSIDLVGPGRF